MSFFKRIIFLLVFLTTVSQAQEPLVTDRPDVAESALTVGRGRAQIETGVTFSRSGGVDTISLPTLLRLGLSKKWEFRIESDTLNFQDPGRSFFSDTSLGAKVNFLESDKSNLGLLFNLNIPIGPEELRGTVDPSLALLWDQSLVGDLSLGVNTGLALSGEGDQRFVQFSWATSFSHPVTEKTNAYVEFFGEGPEIAGGAVQTAVDGGFTYLLNPDSQLDISYARGLSQGGFDWSLGAGFSQRF